MRSVSEFSSRATQLANAYPDALPESATGVERVLWGATLRSLRALRSVLDETPFAAEEMGLLERYAGAHVALLEALRAGRHR
jgi:hypothetical protein